MISDLAGKKKKRGKPESTYPRDETGNQAAQTAEDSRQTDNQFDDRRNDGNRVGHKHPLGHGLVDVQGPVQIAGKQLIDARLVQIPDLDWIEPETGLGLGAVVDLVAIIGLVTGAVSP